MPSFEGGHISSGQVDNMNQQFTILETQFNKKRFTDSPIDDSKKCSLDEMYKEISAPLDTGRSFLALNLQGRQTRALLAKCRLQQKYRILYF